MVSLTFDKMLKALFERNPVMYKRFLSSVLHLGLSPEDMEIVNNNTELPISEYSEYSKTVDFNTNINENILVNLELNNTYFANVKIRNRIYHIKKISLLLKKGAKPSDIKKLNEIDSIQLNLNTKDKSKNLGEDIVVPYSIVTNTVYVDNDKTYIRYLDYYRKLYYNKTTELEESDYWLAILTSQNYVELNDMLSKFVDNDFREEIMKDVISLSNNEQIWDEYERRNADLLVQYETEKNLINEGYEQGAEQKELEMIKSLLESKVDYETISKASGKTIDEIKEIESK